MDLKEVAPRIFPKRTFDIKSKSLVCASKRILKKNSFSTYKNKLYPAKVVYHSTLAAFFFHNNNSPNEKS